MQQIDEKTREIIYSGDAHYSCYLRINDVDIPSEQISLIEISNPIIDTSKDYFYIGTFISQKVDITFKNIEALNINAGDEMTLSIGIDVEGSEALIPIGVYLVDDFEENYQQTNKISCLDYAIKFQKRIDYTPLLENESKTTTLAQILEFICQTCEVDLDEHPTTNLDIVTGAYDNTVSGKQYISWIAELMGCNAKITRDGKLSFKPLKMEADVEIDVRSSKSFSVGEKYHITKVEYADGVRNFSEGDETGNTLNIRSDNIFVTEQKNITNIFDVVEGFTCYKVSNENRGDISLDSWDLIDFYTSDDGEPYKALNHSTLKYQMIITTNIDCKIPSKHQEITTNNLGTPESKISYVKTEVDNINKEIRFLATETYTKENIKDINSGLFVEFLETKDSKYEENKQYYALIDGEYVLQIAGVDYQIGDNIVAKRFEKQNVNVSYVMTEQGTFSDEGLKIERLDEAGKIVSDSSTLFNDTGVEVRKVENGSLKEEEPLLYTGYVTPDNKYYGNEYSGQSITATQNIIVKNWLTIGDLTRIEIFTDDDGQKKTGAFPMGE